MKNRPGIVKRITAAFRAAWRAQTLGELDTWMDRLMSGGPSSSGADVTGETAVNFTSFFSGVFQISQTIASCDTYLYRTERDGSRHIWPQHPLYRVLKLRPNARMDAFRWKEAMQHHAIVWGNGYSVKMVDGSGRVNGLWLLNPERTRVEQEDDGELVYIVRESTGEEFRYSQDQIFHLAGFGFNGVQGYPLLQIHREAIGLGLSQQAFTGRFISNGTHLGGILKHPAKLSDPAHERLRESWPQQYGGAAKAGTTAILEEGMDYQTVGMPLADAQFLESKVFQTQEMARILNISPYKLKDYSHATFSNVEHLGIEYATDTIRPWAERWEAAIDTQLLSESEQLVASSEFDLAGIQRGDVVTMNRGFQIARNGGWMNADEIRQRQGMNKIGDNAGEAYWWPKNMADARDPNAGSSEATGRFPAPEATSNKHGGNGHEEMVFNQREG
ncbi:MAG: phage portal protein [Spirochaetaceae bacterium]|nr:MAG: phage portal protein [Spirochaetaceae bacterium]